MIEKAHSKLIEYGTTLNREQRQQLIDELLILFSVSGSFSPNWKEAYKECFEMFIPINKWDEAQEFLTTYGNGLAKEIAKKEK